MEIVPGDIGPTVSAMIKHYLEDHKMDVELLSQFSTFAHTRLEEVDVFPEGSQGD